MWFDHSTRILGLIGSPSTREHPGDRPQVFCDLFASRSDCLCFLSNWLKKTEGLSPRWLVNTCDSPELDEPYEDVEAEMEALSKVNQELESQAAYVEGRAFSERSQV